jgi:hypothetical protein
MLSSINSNNVIPDLKEMIQIMCFKGADGVHDHGVDFSLLIVAIVFVIIDRMVTLKVTKSTL